MTTTTASNSDDRNDDLVTILREAIRVISVRTNCSWTQGYAEAVLSNTTSSREIAKTIIDKCGRNQTILAIKRIRERFGLSLKDAKTLVDQYHKSGQIVFP